MQSLFALHRKIEKIRPEECSVSYRRLVEKDFRSEGLKNHAANRKGEAFKGTAGQTRRYRTFVDIMTRINIVLDSMIEDEDNVLSVNFVAVGSILLEFMSALSEHMGWSNLIEDFVTRLDKAANENTTGTSTAYDLDGALTDIWQRLLTCIDSESEGTDTLSPQFEIAKVSAFTKSFFDSVEKSRYIYFVEEEEPVHE